MLSVQVAAQRVELLIEEGGAVENPPESLRLEYKFKSGDMQKYDITVTGEGKVKLPGQEDAVKLEARVTMRCVRHLVGGPTSDGHWRIEWDTIKADMLIPEFGQIYLTVPPIQYEMDKRGKVRAFKGLEELALCPGLPQQKTFGDVLAQLPCGGFPDKEIKPGDTWEDLYEVLIPDQQPTRIIVKSKFLGFEKVLEKNCVKIESTYEAPFVLDITKLRGIETKKDSKQEADASKQTDSKEKDKSGGEQASEKPQIVEGVETGTIWTYFAYEEGVLVQTHGKIDLKADDKSEKKTETLPAKPVEPEKKEEASPDVPKETVERTHDVDLTYQTVCLLVTRKDVSEQEEGQTQNEK